MKKEGYNLSMSEILSSIRSDIFSDRNNYEHNNYDREIYTPNKNEMYMSLSDNDNENPTKEPNTTESDDSDILELDDTFLESKDEEFALDTKQQNVVNGNQDINFNNVSEKIKKSRKIDSKNTRAKKTSSTKNTVSQNDMNDEVDNFLKLIEENDSNLTFQTNKDQASQNTSTTNVEQSSDTDILTALNKANELIQQKSSENQRNQNFSDESLKNKFENSSTLNSNFSTLDEASPNTSNNTSIMSESVKKASMKSIYKIIETQKKIQNEKRQTIDDLAMAALIPMLQDWMDKNLAKIVENVVEREISKLINTDN